ncbi:MAG: ribbon-helix-helix domain-containing protein [Candidatus Bathyarchaeia archaeon]
MKTLRISDHLHRKLTATLGTLVAQTGKMQTYEDAIETMLNQSVILPPELLAQIENFIQENKHLGYATREDFIRDAVRWRLKLLEKDYELVEIPRERYEQLSTALKHTKTTHYSPKGFIIKQIDDTLGKIRDKGKTSKTRNL